MSVTPMLTTCRTWKGEISSVMKDFAIPKETQRMILAETKAESKSSDSQELLYERAWRKFKSVLDRMYS